MAHAALIAKVPAAFEKARESGDLLFYPSTVVKHTESDIEYEIRLCPALQQKTAPPTPGNERKVFDPFAPPYNANLYVGDLRDEENHDEFVILMNKFSVVPHHFLLVTKNFKPQGSPLTPSELVQTYLLLSAARKTGKRYFAFFNCGDNSGASQAHKHIQFIPLDPSAEDGPPIERIAQEARIEIPDKPFSLNRLPYANHLYRLPSYFDIHTPYDQLEAVLSGAFLQLLDLAISTIRHDPDYPVGKPSYNVIITLEHIHVIPRRQADHILKETGNTLSVNSLGFAGMLLVKSEDELEAVRREGPSTILRCVGLESVHDMQVEGTAGEGPLSGLL